MTDHSITPPPKLVQQWRSEPEYSDGHHKITMVTMSQDRLMEICEKSALHGADQELEACVKWLNSYMPGKTGDQLLRPFRRPKPPSLREQALANLDEIGSHYIGPGTADRIKNIRRALEALPDD